MQAGEVRVLALLCRPVDPSGFPLHPALFFVTLFLLTCLLAVTLCVSRFTCGSDGALLSRSWCRCSRPIAIGLHVSEEPLPWVAT